MKAIGELFQDLGFNSESSEGSKVALFRHLLRDANTIAAQNLSTSDQPLVDEQLSLGIQLTFDEQVLGTFAKLPAQKIRK